MENGIDISHAETITPVPGQNWIGMNSKSRIEMCQKLLDDYNCGMNVLSANLRGEVIVELQKPLTAGKRGTVLLDAEDILKRYDPSITIYLQAKDDKNPLRKLRGVMINDDRN